MAVNEDDTTGRDGVLIVRGEETDTGGNAHKGVKGRIAETVEALLATKFNPSSLHLTDLERKCQQKIINCS